MYKLMKSILGREPSSVLRTTDGAFIPMSEDNTDYQQYLKWLDAGNTPLPADEQGDA